jgi:hypothetical protein
MRHHGFKAEVQLAGQAAFSLEVRDRLRLFRACRFRQIKRGRDLVWVDILAEVDARLDESNQSGCFFRRHSGRR